MSERDSSRKKSEKKRSTSRTSRPSRRDVRPSTEDESLANEEELDATNETEETTEAASLSHEESQILGDLHALEMVLAELINRRGQVSEDLSAGNLTPSSRSSSTSATTTTTTTTTTKSVERKSLAQQAIELEGELVQEDVDRLDNFLDKLDDQRVHGRQTPSVGHGATPPNSEKSIGSVIMINGQRKSFEEQAIELEGELVQEDVDRLDRFLDKLDDQRTHGRKTPSVGPEATPPNSEKSIGSVITISGQRKSLEEQAIELEDELVQEDIDKLDRFLDKLDDQRVRGRKTPPVVPGAAPPTTERSTKSIIKYEHLTDPRLSHIVSIDEDITNEIKKVDDELRKSSHSGKRSLASSASKATSSATSRSTSRSTSQTREKVIKDVQYFEKAESQGEESSWASFEAYNVPSETSSVQTLPPSNTELIVQYNPDFLTASPSGPLYDPFIHQTLQRILDLKTTFPDQNLYLVPSSSLPADELPLLRSLFEVATTAQAKSQVSEEPSDSSFSPGRTSFVSFASPPDLQTTASVDIERVSEGAMVKQLGNLIGQTLIDYLSGFRSVLSAATATDAPVPKGPSEGQIAVEEEPTTEDYCMAPDSDDRVRDQRARSVSFQSDFNENNSQATETSPAVPLAADVVSSAQPEVAKYVEAIPDPHQPIARATATSKQLETSDAALKSSLRNASTTQSTTKQKPAASTVSVSATVDPASMASATILPSFVKKKVSFADMNSTMYIIVNPSSEELIESAGKSSKESVVTGCRETQPRVALPPPATSCHENDTGAKPCKSLSSSSCYCNPPRAVTSTPTSSIRPDVLQFGKKEMSSTSTEIPADLAPSNHTITGSITHVMCRARSTAEQGRVICGSKDKWVTRVNSRSLSCSNDNAVCPSSRSESFHSNTSDCISLPLVSSPASDISAALRPYISCSNSMMNKNYSCSRTSHGEESDSQSFVKEHTSTCSFPGDNAHEGGSASSLRDCNIAASKSHNNDVCSTVSVVFNVRDRKRTKNKISEK